MLTPPDPPDESSAESPALKKLKEERAADAEKIRQDFIRSQRIQIGTGVDKQPPPRPKEDER